MLWFLGWIYIGYTLVGGDTFDVAEEKAKRFLQQS